MLWRFAIFSFYPLVTFSPVFMYIQQSDQKLWAFCHIYQVVFNIFNFCEKALISNCSNLWQFFVEIFTIRHVDVYSVCLLSEKKRSATRFLIHDCLFFLIHDRHREYICIIRIQLYWRYPVRSFRPPAVVKQKLRYRSSSAPSLFLPPPPPYTHTHTQKGGSKRSPVIGLRTW